MIYIIINIICWLFSQLIQISESLKYQKMVKNVEHCFPESNVVSLNVLFFPQHSTAQIYSLILWQKTKKHIWEAKIKDLDIFFL